MISMVKLTSHRPHGFCLLHKIVSVWSLISRPIVAFFAVSDKRSRKGKAMILNRREFAVSGLALMLAGSLGADVSLAAFPESRQPLNRLTFGASPKSVEEFSKRGLEGWLEWQLSLPPSDEALQHRLAQATLMMEYEAGKDDNSKTWPARKERIAYQHLETTGDKLLPYLDFEKQAIAYEERIRPAREVQAASLIRAVHAQAQLREVMTQFWHDHFNVNAMRDEHTAAYFAIYDKMLRDKAFGNFRDLLGEVTRSPAMLFYLNNEASKASPANENFARELFELHTLGVGNYFNDRTTTWSDVPGAKEGLATGYIDQDVYEAARALTGWSFGDGRYVAEGDNAPMTGEFTYIDRWHDPYQKRILGVEFKANSGPMADGERLLDVLAHHEGTARFLCEKICRRLLADDVPVALLQRTTAVWLRYIDADDQIAQVIRSIVLSPEFSKLQPRKLKRPFEFMASFYRATEAEVASPSLNFIWELSKAGWNQHEFRPPTGHPDHAVYWANTNLISGYVSLALNALQDWSEAGMVNLSVALPKDTMRVADALQFWMKRFSGGETSPETSRTFVAQILGDADAALPTDAGERENMLRGVVAVAALTPQFIYR
jgi:uncharacterized protein (DUF1800 family)